MSSLHDIQWTVCTAILAPRGVGLKNLYCKMDFTKLDSDGCLKEIPDKDTVSVESMYWVLGQIKL
jgi:hypothetical protein